MDKETRTYRTVLDEFCQQTGFKPDDDGQESFYQLADIVVDGVSMSLAPGGDADDPHLLYCCDFGEIPTKKGVLVMVRLLEMNFATSGPAHPSFGLNFATGRVMLTGAVPVAKLDGQHLAAMLRHYAAKAMTWRQTWFLSEEEMKFGDRPSRNAKAQRVRKAAVATGSTTDRKA
ncbi:CesT family type III secretion system chaperone [Noviherbaspirillum aridicola]|uniref:Tir chaperone family protein CesT n=1 Tax=Noviherbaspirillum aridicola TaxID=2849687 RepID=A0ABQ4Q4C8_9BURK|nr:CesT family type III secretion system chaperone [Noviherbaspirillum aridicola]GIZ52043.1 hypothetical protein NCCP691_20570 [Noviherbaspirillum aridicola]